MSGRNGNAITAYISTLHINLSGNEESKSESKQEMNNRGNKYQSHSSSDSKQTNDVTSSYRNACEKTEGRFFQLVSSRQTDNSQEDGSGAFQRNKAYFEELSNERRSTSERDEMEVKENVDVEEISESSVSFESSRQTSFSSSTVEVDHEKESSVEKESSDSSSSSLEMMMDKMDETRSQESHDKLLSSSTSSMDKMDETRSQESHDKLLSSSTSSHSASSSLVSKTTTIQETTTTNSTETSLESRDKTSRSSADRYGETDWYMDILLRMQALDMKQQNLIVQYDFLGKLANETRQDFGLARDWARYESDMSKIEVY